MTFLYLVTEVVTICIVFGIGVWIGMTMKDQDDKR